MRNIKQLLVISLIFALNSGIVNAGVVPLNIQTPVYLDTALMTNPNHSQEFTPELVSINAYADKAQIQAQLNAGINQRIGGDFVALDAELFYGPGSVPIPNQGVILLGTRLSFINNDLGVPSIHIPPSLNMAPGYTTGVVTVAFSPTFGFVAIGLLTYSNYPKSISNEFNIPVTSPVAVAFKEFNLTVNQDLGSGMKTFVILSKGADGFILNYAVRVPNIVVAAAKETPALIIANDPASATVLFQAISRSTAFDKNNIILSTKTFRMPYGGVIKLNGILGGSVTRDQAYAKCKLPFCP